MDDYTQYKENYDRDGFAVVRNFLSADEYEPLFEIVERRKVWAFAHQLDAGIAELGCLVDRRFESQCVLAPETGEGNGEEREFHQFFPAFGPTRAMRIGG